MAVIIRTILTVLFAIDSLLLIVIIMMQKSKDPGLGAIGGMSSDTYWSRNKSRSEEGRLVWITRILAIVFVVLAIVLNMGF